MKIRNMVGIMFICFWLLGIEANAEVDYNGPDGENGYYVNAPVIVIKHAEEGIMRYRLEDANGKVLTGRLDVSMSTVTIQSGVLKDGENILDIWIEDTNGEIIEGSMERMKFSIDQIPPEYPLGFELGDVLKISAKDNVSGVEGIFYAMEGEEYQFVKGEHVFLTLPDKYVGKIHAYAVDCAGNKGELCYYEVKEEKEPEKPIPEESETEEKDTEKPVIEIIGMEDFQISREPLKISCSIKDAGEISELKGLIIQTVQTGEVINYEITEWKKTDDGYQFQSELSEEGVYQIQIEAKDEAGNNEILQKQVIVDPNAPVISRIHEWDGRQVDEFVWNFKAEEKIADLTTCTYEIRIDGILYEQNEVYNKPGMHLLEITAWDMAGNQAKESAQFCVLEQKVKEAEEEHVIEVDEEEKEEKVVQMIEKEEKPKVTKIIEEKEKEEKFVAIGVGGSALVLLLVVLGIVIKKKRSIL